MKIRQLKREPLFVVEFSDRIVFTDYETPSGDEFKTGTFTLGELNTLGQHIDSALLDYDPPMHHVDRVSDDPSNVDTDPPDEYNVFEDEDGHACNTTVDGG